MRRLPEMILGAAAVWLSAAAAAAQDPSGPIFTNKSRFAIPYSYDRAELERMDAREVRLFVSTDEGQSWRHAQTVEPQTGRFRFEAPADGVYWFAVRTLDAYGRLHPAGPEIEPGLKVVVDTREPSLMLTLRQVQPGKVQLEWDASDENLDVETLELEFSQDGESGWQKVHVVAQPRGQTGWSAPKGGIVAVRGRIRDRAANAGHAEDRLHLAPTSEEPQRPYVPDFGRPVAAAPTFPSPSSARGGVRRGSPYPDDATKTAGLVERAGRPAVHERAGSEDPRTAPRAGSGDPRTAPADSRTSRGVQRADALSPNPFAADDGPRMPPQHISPVQRGEPPGRDFEFDDGPTIVPGVASAGSVERLINRRSTESSPILSQSSTTQSLATQRPERPERPGTTDAGEAASSVEERVRPVRVVNTRKFTIGYELEDVGPSGIESVEVFITENDGRKWYRYGDDPDRQSPFEVVVPREGEYGFAFRARSGAGLTSPPPRRGEKPDLTVVVDRSPPMARLLPVQRGQGDDSDCLILRWRVEDEFPASRPVALSYAAQPDGSWTPITQWTENSGRFVWPVPPDVPERLFIRLTARDAAGNVVREITEQPIPADLSRPKVRVVEVEPAETRR